MVMLCTSFHSPLIWNYTGFGLHWFCFSLVFGLRRFRFTLVLFYIGFGAHWVWFTLVLVYIGFCLHWCRITLVLFLIGFHCLSFRDYDQACFGMFIIYSHGVWLCM